MAQLWVNMNILKLKNSKNSLKIGVASHTVGVASHTVGVAEDKVGGAAAPPTVWETPPVPMNGYPNDPGTLFLLKAMIKASLL